jgi:hypothetical protein
MKKIITTLLIIGLLAFIPFVDLFSHSGRTDSNGGHYNRKTGEYHYHNSGYKKPSKEKNYQKELIHWLNTKSGVRHSSSCRYYKNTSKGKSCKPDQGRACKICGG